MGDSIFRIVINLLIAAGTFIIVILGAKKIHYLEKELDQRYHPDTTMVVMSDTLSGQFILEE